ncbi:MAG: tetratricopeptide repeat protein [Fimbriimonas ginsengisoli]|uniref:Tetratricopeptide repeat protein n=1 Tax=Fimbriimonas ginsengisoli TaxID=1005039 RepID=A0A931M1M5_FIMGI|nr:tetratricopeptide repeat protein [Fimbriimonas ginsengisoli]MBI3721883.1 tetratricopeptide repeat protein [Fimbriimonas ginsengisoli]
MEAPAPEKKFNICDRCFASVPVTQPFCPECGAPLGSEELLTRDAGETAYAELARANLLRMRGEYKEAEEQCLAVLRRLPNNAGANTLLGDICAERNDLEHAMQWYELAVDLLPGDAAIKRKLDNVAERLRTAEAAATARDLGFPRSSSQKTRFVLSLLLPILMVAVAAYYMGQKQGAKPPSAGNASVTAPVEAPAQGSGTAGAERRPENTAALALVGDTDLLAQLQKASTDGYRAYLVFEDPRDKALLLCFGALDADYRSVAARLARSLTELAPDALRVTVRGLRGGKLVYTADVLRSRLKEVSDPSWSEQNSKETWVDHILTNEWTATDLTPPATPQPEPQTPTQAPQSAQPADDSKSTVPAPSDKGAGQPESPQPKETPPTTEPPTKSGDGTQQG